MAFKNQIKIYKAFESNDYQQAYDYLVEAISASESPMSEDYQTNINDMLMACLDIVKDRIATIADKLDPKKINLELVEQILPIDIVWSRIYRKHSIFGLRQDVFTELLKELPDERDVIYDLYVIARARLKISVDDRPAEFGTMLDWAYGKAK